MVSVALPLAVVSRLKNTPSLCSSLWRLPENMAQGKRLKCIFTVNRIHSCRISPRPLTGTLVNIDKLESQLLSLRNAFAHARARPFSSPRIQLPNSSAFRPLSLSVFVASVYPERMSYTPPPSLSCLCLAITVLATTPSFSHSFLPPPFRSRRRARRCPMLRSCFRYLRAPSFSCPAS